MLGTDYPITVVCHGLDLPRSTQYYRPVVADEDALKQALEDVAQAFPTYGSRRLTAQVRRAPHRLRIGRRRVRRLRGELGLKRRPKLRICRTTNSQHACVRYPNLVAERTARVPDEIWVSDITYIRLHTEFIYLAVIMDVFTRDIRGWNLSRSLGQELTLGAVQHALAHHVPQIHHSDQGIQYAAPTYIQTLRQAGVVISMATVGEPREKEWDSYCTSICWLRIKLLAAPFALPLARQCRLRSIVEPITLVAAAFSPQQPSSAPDLHGRTGHVQALRQFFARQQPPLPQPAVMVRELVTPTQFPDQGAVKLRALT